MVRKLYFGQPWDEPGYPDSWISFEDNAEFSLTGAKSVACQACLNALQKGLLSYVPRHAIDIGPGAHCWKAVVSIEGMNTPQDAGRFLAKHQDDFLPSKSGMHGKLGGGETPGQQQILIHCDNIVQAETYKHSMKTWLTSHHSNLLNSYSTEQGCKHPFLELFGSVPSRNQMMIPASPQAVRTTLDLYLQDSTIASFDPVLSQPRKIPPPPHPDRKP